MGKHFLLSIVFLAVRGSFAHAQQGPDLLEEFQKYYRMQLRQAAGLQSAAKTTGIGSRLVQAYTGQGVTGGVIRNLDSTSYTYSGGRGGDLDSWAVPAWLFMPPCDSMIYREWVPSTASYVIRHITRNTYNGANQLDSNTEYDITNPRQNFLTTFGYNAAGQLSNVVQLIKDPSAAASWIPQTHVALAYTGTGNISDILYERWDAGAGVWTFRQHDTIVYNAANQPLLNLGEMYVGTVKAVVDSVIYTYDGLGNLTSLVARNYDYPSSTFQDLVRYRYYYNVFRIAETYEHEYNGVLRREDSTTYQSIGAPVVKTITHYIWNATNSNWVLGERTTLTSGASGKTERKLIEYSNLGPFHYNDQRTFYFYNSFGQETHEYSQSLVNGNWVIYPNNDHERRYYYQSFNTGINSTASASEIGIQLIPVPAGSSVTAVLGFNTRQSFTAVITDVGGRQVYSWTDHANGFYTRELDMRNLPSGTYYLSVFMSAGIAAKSFIVRH